MSIPTGALAEALVVAAPLRLEARALRRGAPGLRVLRTGMGPVRAGRAARRLASDPARALAVAGLCGALDPGLLPGDVVVASALVGPDGARRELDCDALYEQLVAFGLRVRAVPLASVDHVVRGAERPRLRDTGARAVDMESAWLAEAAGDRPLAVVRVVLDGPNHELWRPAALGQLRTALKSLRAAGPGLARWVGEVAGEAAPVGSPPAYALL